MKLIPFKLSHTHEVLSWIKTEAEMVQWAGPIFTWPMAQKQFREHIGAGITPPPSLYPFVLTESNRIAGYCELSGHNRNSNQATLSRVIIAPKHRNRGMATFMTNEVLRFGFEQLGLHRIGLGVFDFNEPAITCYKNAGFRLEGTLRESAKVGDSYWNCHLMSILRREWNR
jgi:RimJ/RimL family protein N-acetyltransferase